MISAILVALAATVLGWTTSQGRTDEFDRSVLVWMRVHWGAVHGLRSVMLGATALGDFVTLSLFALAVASWLVLNGRVGSALFLLVQAATGSGIVHLMKPWFGRARPEVVAHWGPYAGLSFPSGHSADAAIVYLSIAIIAARGVHRRTLRLGIALGAGSVVVLVGMSRMYLGVHWPTDVLGGWLFGAAWAMAAATLARWRSHTVGTFARPN